MARLSGCLSTRLTGASAWVSAWPGLGSGEDTASELCGEVKGEEGGLVSEAGGLLESRNLCVI